MIQIFKTTYSRGLVRYVKMVLLAFPLAVSLNAQAQDDREQLLQRIAELEQQLQRIDQIEQRLSELETTAVLSDPETYVSRVEVFVDDDGVEYETQEPGTRPVVTYQRNRVYRRQTINEKIEDALAGEAESSVQLGVDAAITMQYASQTKGNDGPADGEWKILRRVDYPVMPTQEEWMQFIRTLRAGE